MGRHAQASDAQHMLPHLSRLHRGGSGFPTRARPQTLARISRFADRQLPRHRSGGFSGSRLNGVYLSRRWAEGCVRGRELLHQIKLRGYTGSFSHLERLLTKWRRSDDAKVSAAPVAEPKTELKPTMVTAPAVGLHLTSSARGGRSQ